MSANELIAEIKALSESERDRVYRLLLADIEFRRAIQASAPPAAPSGVSGRPLARLAEAVASFPSDPKTPTNAAEQHPNSQPISYGTPAASWRFPEALSLGPLNGSVEDWRLMANEPGV